MIYCIHGTLNQGASFLKSNHLACLLRSRLSGCHATPPFLLGKRCVTSRKTAAKETIICPLPWIHTPELKVLVLFL